MLGQRRPGRTALALAVPMFLFVLFGMTLVAAPATALGLLFDSPAEFAAVAAFVSVAGAALLFTRPVELAVARAVAGSSRVPTAAEAERLGPILRRVGDRTGVRTARLVTRVEPGPGVNASAGAAHLMFVTTGALALPDGELEGVLAHELGHHRGLHPILGAVVWWLRLPGAAIAAVYRALRRAVAALGLRLGALGRLLALPLVALLVVWQVAVMWLFYVAELLALRAARMSEFEADASAARWGYGPQLTAALEGLAHHQLEPAGRWARLMADHPPLSARIERLRP